MRHKPQWYLKGIVMDYIKIILGTIQNKECSIESAVKRIYAITGITILAHILDTRYYQYMFDWIDWILYIAGIYILWTAAANLKSDAMPMDSIAVRAFKAKVEIIFILQCILFVNDVFAVHIMMSAYIWLIANLIKNITIISLPASLYLEAKKRSARNADIFNKKILSIEIGYILSYAVFYFYFSSWEINEIYRIGLMVAGTCFWVYYTYRSVKMTMILYGALGKIEDNASIDYKDSTDSIDSADQGNFSRLDKEESYYREPHRERSAYLYEYEISDHKYKRILPALAVFVDRVIVKIVSLTKKCYPILIVLSFIYIAIGLVGANLYAEGEYDITDDTGNKISDLKTIYNYSRDEYHDNRDGHDYYTYTAENIMPEWTLLHRYKTGIVRDDGYTTGKMYPTESLGIDTQGVMPDGKGHIIDLEGNIVMDLPYMYKAGISLRTAFYRDMADIHDYDDYYHYGCLSRQRFGIYKLSEDDHRKESRYITDTGIVAFYSYVTNGNGLCRNGKIIFWPVYEDISIGLRSDDVIVTEDKNRKYAIYNKDMEKYPLYDRECSVTKLPVPKLLVCNYYDSILRGNYYMIMDYDGRTIVDNVYECTIYGYSYGQETIPFRKNGKAYKIGADHEVYRDYEND